MSTSFILTNNIPINEIKRLENYEGIKVEFNPVIDGEKYEDYILISSKDLDNGNTNYLHGEINLDDTINFFRRYGGNNPERIIQCIEDEFNTHCIDEYQDEFEKICNPEEYEEYYNNV